MNAHVEKSILHFSEFVRLLRELHRLIREGKGDSPESDVIRDEMDLHWPHLTASQIELTEGLSAALYSLTNNENHAPRDLANPVSKTDLQAAWNAEKFERLLNLLRRPVPSLAPDEIAFLRGYSWTELGDLETALLFLARAVELAPANQQYQAMKMMALFRLGRPGEAHDLAVQLAADSTLNAPEVLLPVAGVMFSGVESLGVPDKNSEIERVAQLILRAFDFDRQRTGALRLQVAQVARYYVVLAMCYESVGRRADELNAYSKALEFDPTNDDAKRGQQLAKNGRAITTNGASSVQHDARQEILFATLMRDGPTAARYFATCI